MMKKQIYHFNLIEIVLTVAVVAFGVVIILGMLPKGLQATRSASAVTYASGIIDQMGGDLQVRGAESITRTSFDDSVVDDERITKTYNGLVGHQDESSFSNENFLRNGHARGVFQYKHADDVYVVIMGDEREIAGENESRVDFAGMIRVCKQTGSNREGRVAAVTHKGVSEGSELPEGHECFDSDGKLQCGSEQGKFHAKDIRLKGATVYMELSYPLSVPYAERKKVYYSFDVKE